jgi:hypothetical protein
VIEPTNTPPRAADAVAALRKQAQAAYRERDSLVCAFSKVFPSWLARHPESDTEWDDEWRWIVFVQLPTGQASWHIHDSERPWFDHLEVRADGGWDGHTTEEKYRRLAMMSPGAAVAQSAEREAAPAAYLDFVFDKIPDGPDGPRLIEVENERGASVRAGEWLQRSGCAVLRVPMRGAPAAGEDGRLAELRAEVGSMIDFAVDSANLPVARSLTTVAKRIDALLAAPLTSAGTERAVEGFEARRAMREQFGRPRVVIQIEGPGRDYDWTAFCCDHNVEAERCAAEWTAEVIDSLDTGEEQFVRMSSRRWCEGVDQCHECERASQPAAGTERAGGADGRV